MFKNIDESRRHFIKSIVGLSGFSLYHLATRNVLANSPNDRITMGFIGTGNMGMSNLNGFLHKNGVQVVAVCDVDKSRRLKAKQVVDDHYGNPDCKSYNDFRNITRHPDIDAVVVTTPDHWHTIPALDAARHGKDMYVEKPLTLTISEGRELCNTINQYGRILQTGSHQRSMDKFRFACELVRNGYIGEIKTVEVTIPGNNRTTGPTWTKEPVPPGFDYNFWLGPAPWEPYTEQRCHYQFRFILDYSGGQVTNWGAHYLDIAQWGLGMDKSGPVQIIGRGEFPSTGLFTTATTVDFECLYENDVKLTCRTGGAGTKFIGSDGWIFVNRSVLETNPKSLAATSIKPDEIHLEKSNDHRVNFLQSVRNRNKPVAHEEIGHRSATLCHLGNIAMLLKSTLKWNPKTELFEHNSVANNMLKRPLRSPWHV